MLRAGLRTPGLKPGMPLTESEGTLRSKLNLFLASILAAIPAVALSAEQATQFDLLCIGEARFTPTERPRPVEHRFRVNIEEMRWCWEACERTFPLAGATVDRITFNQEPEGGGYSSYVSRIDGSYSRTRLKGRGPWLAENGTCEPAPFSGMPEPKF